jgi:hypothetical protein
MNKLANESWQTGKVLLSPSASKVVPYPVKRRAGRSIVQRITPLDRLGYPTGYRCWCGNELTFRYGEHGVMAKRKAWFEKHELCEPPKDEV